MHRPPIPGMGVRTGISYKKSSLYKSCVQNLRQYVANGVLCTAFTCTNVNSFVVLSIVILSDTTVDFDTVVKCEQI